MPKPTDNRTIDIVSGMTEDEAKNLARAMIEDVTRLTHVIEARGFPIQWWRGEGAIDTAIRFMIECKCR